MTINISPWLKGLVFCLLFNSTILNAVEERFPLVSDHQRQVFAELTANLRCPKCQNQNIADSNATVSIDMKRKVHQLLLQGKSEAYIIDYMKQRYGDFVYYQPPVNATTLVLWIGPLLVLFGVLWLFFREKKYQSSESKVVENSQLEDIDKLLNKGKLKNKDIS